MDCCLEHFLLVMDLPQKLPCEFASVWVAFKPAAVGFDLKKLFGWDFYFEPLTKFHLFSAKRSHFADEMPPMQ